MSIFTLYGQSAFGLGMSFLGKHDDAYIVGTLVSPQEARKGPFSVHLNADGSVDTNYGTNGVVRPDYLADYRINNPMSFVVSRKGEVTVSASNCSFTLVCTQYLARIDKNGDMDTSFGEPSKPGFLALSQTGLTTGGRILQQQKKQIVAHNVTGQPGVRYATRFEEDGTVDTSFGNQGHVTLTTNRHSGSWTIRRSSRRTTTKSTC